jgi:co-chaperonin GroES (HSP10)
MHSLIPHKDRVILESFPDDARGTPLVRQSVVLTDEYQNEPSRLAKVLAIGPDVEELLFEGDTVFCHRYPPSAWSFNFEGRELVSVKEEDILARIEVK